MKNISRRQFLKDSLMGAAAFAIVPGNVLGKTYGYKAPSDKLNIAGIGVGGVGRRNMHNMKTENIVALCDVDWKYAMKTFNDYPKAKVIFDSFHISEGYQYTNSFGLYRSEEHTSELQSLS